MRLSFGVYVTAMNACLNKEHTRDRLVQSILASIDTDHEYIYTPQNMTKWCNCENDFAVPAPNFTEYKNEFQNIKIAARAANLTEVAARFTENVVPKISKGKLKNLVAMMKHLVNKDDSIADADFEALVGRKKEDFLAFDYSDALGEFFAGLFRYALLEVDNRAGRDCNNEEYANCPIKKAKSNPGEKYDSKHRIKPEYADKVNDAINSCDKDCVLRITEEYISTFAKTEDSSESAGEDEIRENDKIQDIVNSNELKISETVNPVPFPSKELISQPLPQVGCFNVYNNIGNHQQFIQTMNIIGDNKQG